VGAGALAIHPGALGDVLLAVPALRALRAAAGAPVVLAAQPHLGALLTALGVVDDHVAFDALGLDGLFVDDEARRPRLPAVRRLVCWFGARDPIFVRRLTALVPGAVVAPSVAGDQPVWEHLLATVDPAARPSDWRAPVVAPASVRALGAAHLAAAPPPWLIVHPGAGGAAKCWPAAAFARVITTVAARARMNVLAHRGPADEAPAAALRQRLGAGLRWLDEPALPLLAGVLAGAQVYLGNDSGVSHLAAALGVPSVVLFDRRHLAWRPWWDGARVRPVTLTEPVAGEVETVTDDVVALFR
jgi:ADP-heptose:LPS heptosyltransferase